ncbi:Putative methyltransferase [Idiomarina sp. A28L]|uniref:class I SAM-dependent methyltransferase n=1 Tax=Idiomarina sp. A28L TaxID=1036674 RepID=UPI0002138AA5|nr:class I SAM-dependent methyltransferase [Idiomarina sp. A28L]EGN75331.1 Putative methyltransferase [Idiomarina sp. A28L]
MKRSILCSSTLLLSFALVACQPSAQQSAAVADAPQATPAPNLTSMLHNPSRTAANTARDQYRNPVETLEFFGVEPHMTVVEIWPGGGWYSEILAPYLHANGQYYAAHFPQSETRQGYVNSRNRFAERVGSDALFANTIITEFAPLEQSAIAPAGTADVVLTFRNVHNWYMGDGETALAGAFETFFAALKPGGVLGVVDHRLPENRPDEAMRSSGYVKQSLIIKYAEQAGFVLAGSSDVNANPQDTADHPRGVWTLPPSLRLGDENRAHYEAIGESDRFTLKFVKPVTSE